jgi:uncharacterized protein YkwD
VIIIVIALVFSGDDKPTTTPIEPEPTIIQEESQPTEIQITPQVNEIAETEQDVQAILDDADANIQQQLEQQRVDLERQKAELEQQKAEKSRRDLEQQKANVERQKAELEQQKADKAKQEVAEHQRAEAANNQQQQRISTALVHADKALRMKDYGAAKRTAREILASSPNNAQALRILRQAEAGEAKAFDEMVIE